MSRQGKIDRAFTFATDTASLVIFDPQALSARADDPVDWWARDFSTIQEVRDGQVVAVGLGSDGVYRAAVRVGELTPAERQWASEVLGPLGFEVTSGTVVIGAGESLPGGGRDGSKLDDGLGTTLKLPPGRHVARVYAINWQANPQWAEADDPKDAPADWVVLIEQANKAPAKLKSEARFKGAAGFLFARGPGSPAKKPAPKEAPPTTEEREKEAAYQRSQKFIKLRDEAEALYEQDKSKQAAAKATEALKLEDHAATYLLRGIAYEDLGQPKKALADFTRAIELDDARGYRHRARLHLAADDAEAAKADASRAIDVDSGGEDAEARFLRGSASETLGDIEAALEDYAKAAQMQPERVQYVYAHGTALYQSGNLKEGVRVLSRAIKLEPEGPDIWTNRADAYLNLGKFEEAAADCERALKLDPKHAIALADYAEALVRLGRHDEALATADKLAKVEPADTGVFVTRARVLLLDSKRRDVKKATQLAKKACDLCGESEPWPLVALAEAHAAAGDSAKAKLLARQALEVAPPYMKSNIAGLVRRLT